ncbi:MAG: hypothetical protein DRP11_00895 [Candidatus Aenigmatarchaeota archaeon]|nr:MAG: hypothetical protein DRP11_00895 [Candidatus Aenigmarchaeota archaeon]
MELIKKEVCALLLVVGGIIGIFGSLILIAWASWDLMNYNASFIDEDEAKTYKWCSPFFVICWDYKNWTAGFDFFYTLSLLICFVSIFTLMLGSYYLGKIKE